MKFTKQQINDLRKIMSAERDMIPLLPLFRPRNRILNPWEKQFPKIFKKLRLKKGMTLLDIPCGQGGVSVPLAKIYGVNVTGYDIIPAYVRYAKEYAKETGVSNLCTYKIGDIREAVKRSDNCDVLLWVGPPHVWGNSKPTVKALRNSVRNGGLIVIADAYLFPGIRKKGFYKDYENLKDTNKGYAYFGDEIINIYDYRDTLWNFDYSRTRKEVKAAIKRAKRIKEKNVIKKYLTSLDTFEEKENKELGLAIWVLRVNKR